MATSPLFGWEEPDDTDLVKDGAAAIRTLGDAIDTSMGDLLGGTTGQVLAKASGTNMDFTWTTPSAGSSYVSGKNGILNAAFDVWQRSTSATFAGTVAWPAADRWFGVALGSSPTCTMSRQTADTTGLTYGMRFGRNSGQTATGDVYVGNTFESINAKQFAGQTVTLSFYAKKGADAPATLYSQIRTGTGTDQTSATLFSTGWTSGANNSQANTITSTMTRYSYTVALGSTVNQIMVAFTYGNTGTAGANEWFQIEGVQLEIASSASAFSRATPTIQSELAACQRYYWRNTPGQTYGNIGFGNAYGTADTVFVIPNPVQMRVPATSVDYSTLFISDINNPGKAVTAVTLQTNGQSPLATGLVISVASSLTQYRPYYLSANNSTSAYLGVSAEL